MTDLKHLNKQFEHLITDKSNYYLETKFIDNIFIYKPLAKKYKYQRCLINHNPLMSRLDVIEAIIHMYKISENEFNKLGYTSETKFSSVNGDIFLDCPHTPGIEFTLINNGPELKLFSWHD